MLGFKEREMSHVCVTRAALLDLAHRPQQQVSPSLSLSIWKVGPSVGFEELLRASVGWCAVKCLTLEHSGLGRSPGAECLPGTTNSRVLSLNTTKFRHSGAHL